MRLRVLRVPSPLVRPFITAVRQTDHLDVVLVEATDADGRRGYGEAATSWRVTGESPQSVAAAVAGPLAEAVRGRDAGDPGLAVDITRSIWGNAAARSAVECAVADLAAQQQGVSLAACLSRAYAVHDSSRTSRIRTDMTLSVGEPDAVAALSEEYVTAGFGCLKLKASAAHDTVAGLRAVRAAVGPDVTLRIDANQAWDAETAIRVIRAAEDAGLGIELVEQPVATPIMADESVRTAQDVRRVAERGAADLVNIKLAKTGGLAEALAAAEAAREAGLGVVIGCMMESHVGVSAAAHLAAVVAPGVVHDLDAAFWLQRSPVIGGVVPSGDVLLLEADAGLGISALAADAHPEVLLDLPVGAEVRA